MKIEPMTDLGREIAEEPDGARYKGLLELFEMERHEAESLLTQALAPGEHDEVQRRVEALHAAEVIVRAIGLAHQDKMK